MLIIIITLGLLIGALVFVVYSVGSFTPVIDGPIGCLPGFTFFGRTFVRIPYATQYDHETQITKDFITGCVST
ncbi:hypothetical protein PNOK_0422400 [Pyrrhoderma noxium]|uniref:Uncharacterized protein n=1 Tax=Pyrrhoderma noxium TaxID=2282107 RepID=A0A286UI59_9AGAM|nr:hypothetical protein PNOK_0422400 [Pyrrhoderma noxium]